MGSVCAPVVMLVFRRPDLTRQVFERVREAKPTTLIVVADGARKGSPSEAALVRETRELVADVDWECIVHRIYSDSNLGLKARVTSGLDQAFELVDSAIILEDDCVPAASFFPYATELLGRYRDNPSVGTIAGTSRVRGHMPSQDSYDFSSDLRIWGWATWARTWQGFSRSGDLNRRWDMEEQNDLVANLKGGRKQAVARMLRVAHALDSWALPFLGHVMSRRYLHAVPEKNLVENIGFGSESTHTKFESFVEQVPAEEMTFPLRHPLNVTENPAIDIFEARQDAKFALRYVVSHPLRVVARVIRYVRTR